MQEKNSLTKSTDPLLLMMIVPTFTDISDVSKKVRSAFKASDLRQRCKFSPLSLTASVWRLPLGWTAIAPKNDVSMQHISKLYRLAFGSDLAKVRLYVTHYIIRMR